MMTLSTGLPLSLRLGSRLIALIAFHHLPKQHKFYNKGQVLPMIAYCRLQVLPSRRVVVDKWPYLAASTRL